MHTTRQHRLPLLTGLLLVASACSTGPELDIILHDTDRGAVYLERISDRSLQTTHPIMLSADTMARVLRGVVVKENRGFLGGLVGSKPEPVRALGDEDVEYLAPLLVEGLTRAASDQQVGFRVGKTGPPAELRKGSLYAYRQSLYLTLPWLIAVSRYGAGGPALASTILFIPESAKRPDSYRDARSTESTLVIDYALLATLPANASVPPSSVVPSGGPAATAGQSTAPSQTPQEVQQGSVSKDSELQDLKKELQGIKRQLAEQEAERNAQKQKGPSKQTSPSTP
jgi:hypothetical protein